MGILPSFSVGMGWVWKLKSNSHGSFTDIWSSVKMVADTFYCRHRHAT